MKCLFRSFNTFLKFSFSYKSYIHKTLYHMIHNTFFHNVCGNAKHLKLKTLLSFLPVTHFDLLQ